MLTRRQYETLLIILTLVVVALLWALSSQNIALPTLPRLGTSDEPAAIISVERVDVPDVIARQMAAVELGASTGAAAYPDLILRQAMAVEAAARAAIVSTYANYPDLILRQAMAVQPGDIRQQEGGVVVQPIALAPDIPAGLPVLTARAQAQVAHLAALNAADYQVGLPVMAARALQTREQMMALNADYQVGLPVLTARAQPPREPKMALTTDYQVGLPVLSARTLQTRERIMALNADYQVGLPVLTERARQTRARMMALTADYQVGLPILTERSRARLAAPQSSPARWIYEASLNWADFPASQPIEK